MLVVPSGPTVVYVVASVLEVRVSGPTVGEGVVGLLFVGVLTGGVVVGVVGVSGVEVGGLSVEVSVGSVVSVVSVVPGVVVGVSDVVVYKAVWLKRMLEGILEQIFAHSSLNVI